MAFRFEKEKTASTPYILVDEEKKYMKLEGRSFHENVVTLFEEINNWLDDFLPSDFGEFTFDCELNYLNSSTVKLLFNMLLKMDRAIGAQSQSKEKKIIVNWITFDSNDIIIECGEDFKEEVNNLTFNIVIN
jgi:hypothetical protein